VKMYSKKHHLLPVISIILAAFTLFKLGLCRLEPAEKQNKNEIVIVAGGDVLLDGKVRYAEGFGGDGYGIFSGIASVVSAADLAFANLEFPFTSKCSCQPKEFCFHCDPIKAMGLARAGFDIMTLANNHTYDCGRDAIMESVGTLDKAGIKHAGAGPNYAEAMKPAIFDLAGWKVAVFSFTIFGLQGLKWNPDAPTVAYAQEPDMISAVRAVRGSVDTVIVSLHWGHEFTWSPIPPQRRLAVSLSQAGADVIVGHHPHILEPCTRINNTWVAYSLGNLVFGSKSFEAKRTALMRIIIDKKSKDIRIEFVPLEIKRCRPFPASGEIAEIISHRLTMPNDRIVWRVSGEKIVAK